MCSTENFDSIKNILPISLHNNKCFSWVKVNGTLYAVSSVINISSNDCACYKKIKYIVMDENNAILFLCTTIQNLSFCKHLSAIEIKETQEWELINQKSLIDYNSYKDHMVGDSKNYIIFYTLSMNYKIN